MVLSSRDHIAAGSSGCTGETPCAAGYFYYGEACLQCHEACRDTCSIPGNTGAFSPSPDGLKLIIGTASGTIGVLDEPTLKHATIVRSHTEIIYGLALDPHNREFATASCDGSIRVWELDGNQAQARGRGPDPRHALSAAARC